MRAVLSLGLLLSALAIRCDAQEPHPRQEAVPAQHPPTVLVPPRVDSSHCTLDLRSHRDQSRLLIAGGGALLILGAIVHHTGGLLLAIGGVGVGAYGYGRLHGL
jgi:hypothetical protein